MSTDNTADLAAWIVEKDGRSIRIPRAVEAAGPEAVDAYVAAECAKEDATPAPATDEPTAPASTTRKRTR